jgi:CHAD domain-containing protein
MNREDVIENMVEQYRDQLEAQDDEELLGNRLEIFRENANVLVSNMLESLREETIEEMVKRYQRHLDGKPDEELIGGQDDSEQ